jgi:DNA-binding XRE family transcriptional regulator
MKRDGEIVRQLREKFFRDIQTNSLTIGEAVKSMRKIAGLTQPDYAKFLGIAHRTLLDIENNNANPTLKTLNAIGEKFGLEVSFIHKQKK